jgi:hypothetical protein
LIASRSKRPLILILESDLFINMKKILLFILFISNLAFAQNEFFIVGGGGGLYSPFGSLSDRFNSTIGFELQAGKRISEKWTWIGKLEYLKFDDVNNETLVLRKEVEVNGSPTSFDIPLGNVDMELEIIGLTANAGYSIFSNEIIDAKFNFGFGLFRWISKRSNYSDSLFVDTSGTGGLKLADVLNVPAVSQTDWSGGFNIGLDASVKVFEPVWIYVSADYKAVISELYPTLNLNLENVSTFQMLNGKIGVRLKL